MNATLWATWLLALAGIGCSVGDRDKPPASDAAPPITTTKQPMSDEESTLGEFVSKFSDLPVVDESEATLEANGIDFLRETHAVLAESIGIEIYGGEFLPLINAGTIIPARKTQEFGTLETGQQEMEFRFYRGTAQQVSENHLIGSIRVLGIPPTLPRAARIEIKLQIMRNGDLHLSARDLTSGKPLKLRQVKL